MSYDWFMEGGRSQNCLFVVVRLRHQGIRVAGNGSQLCFPGTLTVQEKTQIAWFIGLGSSDSNIFPSSFLGWDGCSCVGMKTGSCCSFFCGGLVRMVLCRFFECVLWSSERTAVTLAKSGLPPSKSLHTRGLNHLGSTSALWCYSTLQLWQLRLERHGRCQKVVKKHWASWKKLDQWSFPKDQRDLSWFLESHQRVFLTETVLADFFSNSAYSSNSRCPHWACTSDWCRCACDQRSNSAFRIAEMIIDCTWLYYSKYCEPSSEATRMFWTLLK